MPPQPTIVITSCGVSPGNGEAILGFDRAWGLAQSLTACRLPMVLVTSERRIHPAAVSPDALLRVCVVQPHAADPFDHHVEALVEGVLFSAQSPGWVWVPADMPMLRPDTVCAVADRLCTASLTHAEHADRAGAPLGIGAELFSEVIHLTGHADLLRLRSRYPAQAVPTQDPGVLMSDVGHVAVAAPAVHPHTPPGKPLR